MYHFVYMYVYFKLISSTVISEPDNVTVCEGKATTLTCALSNNIGGDVQWYRFIMDTSITEVVDPEDDQSINIFTHTGNTLNSSLTITDAVKSYSGYYWVETSYFNACNVSLTVLAS